MLDDVRPQFDVLAPRRAVSKASPCSPHDVRQRSRRVVAGASFFSVFALVVFVVPNLFPGLFQSKGSEKSNADIVSLDAAAKEFATNNAGKWPSSLDLLVVPDANGKSYLGVRTLPKDPWGRAYRYDPRPRIYSLGRDGVVGGTGEDADFDNRDAR